MPEKYHKTCPPALCENAGKAWSSRQRVWIGAFTNCAHCPQCIFQCGQCAQFVKAPFPPLCLEDQAFPAFSHKAGGHVLWYFWGILRVEGFERLYSRQHILCCRRDFHLQGIQKRGGISTDLRIAVSNAMQVVKLPWGEVLCCCHDFCKRFP